MFCKYCGAPIADDSKFCPHCGQCLTEERNPTEEAAATTETDDASSSPLREEREADQEKETVTENRTTEMYPPKDSVNQASADPFIGKAHPSVKRNLIIAGIAVGIATILSILLMIVGIVSAVKSGTFEDGMNALKSEESETFPADQDEFDPSEQKQIDLGKAGNTVGNSLNIGIAVDDGEGGVYYCDENTVYHRSADSEISEITSGNGDYYTNINRIGQELYYIVNFTDSDQQNIMCYNMETETESSLAETDELIHYMMAYDDELYYATEFTIFAMEPKSKLFRSVYTADETLYDVFVTEDGIYYSRITTDGSYGLYRRDFRGDEEQYITTGDFFDFSAGTLYINRMDEYGNDILYQADGNGNEEKEIYRFSNADEMTYIVGMQIRNNICYCITETLQYDDDLYYDVRAVNLTNGDERIIDKDFTSEENPFANLNIAGGWLFYYDATFSYGLHLYELPM